VDGTAGDYNQNGDNQNGYDVEITDYDGNSFSVSSEQDMF